MTPAKIPFVEIAAELAERKTKSVEPKVPYASVFTLARPKDLGDYLFTIKTLRIESTDAIALERELAAKWRPTLG